MIGTETVHELVNEHLADTDLFIVDIQVSSTNNIRILVDNDRGVTVKDCISLSRAVEKSLERYQENFELEVSSPGLSEPLKVIQQYKKNIGKEIEVITKEGIKHKGKLAGLSGKGIVLEETVKVKGDKKRPETVMQEKVFNFDLISSIKVLVSFK